MLRRIAKIKRSLDQLNFDAEEVRDLALNMRSEGFISRADRFDIKDNIKVALIQDPNELLVLGRNLHSCLYKKHLFDEPQLAAYSRFLSDPGALYFSLESDDCIGYFRFYAGELVEDNRKILFEDVLRTQRKPLEGNLSALFHPQLKAITALTMERLGLVDESFLYVPYDNLQTYDGRQLQLIKLGAESFKKGFSGDFYNGQVEDTGWPRFARVEELLR